MSRRRGRARARWPRGASARGDRGAHRHSRRSALRELARDFAAADGAAAYGRTGSCLGRFGTLVAFLLDALNAVTGNLDRPGGAVFGRPPIALDDVGEQVGLATYGKLRSRIGGFPDVIGNLPAALLPREIETPGEGQIRALFVSAGNPVLSVPDGEALERALGELDLLRLARPLRERDQPPRRLRAARDHVLRARGPADRAAWASSPPRSSSSPRRWSSPPGECRQEWEIVDEHRAPDRRGALQRAAAARGSRGSACA